MLIFDTHDDSYIEELSTYVSIPSVSRDASAQTMQMAAEWLASQLSFANGRVGKSVV